MALKQYPVVVAYDDGTHQESPVSQANPLPVAIVSGGGTQVLKLLDAVTGAQNGGWFTWNGGWGEFDGVAPSGTFGGSSLILQKQGDDVGLTPVALGGETTMAQNGCARFNQAAGTKIRAILSAGTPVAVTATAKSTT